MRLRKFIVPFVLLLTLSLVFFLAACADGDEDADTGLTEAQVDAIVQDAIAAMPAPDAGLTQAEVEAIVQSAMAAAPDPQPALTAAEVEEIVEEAVGHMDDHEGLTAAEVEAVLRSALTALPQTGVTEEQAAAIARAVVASIPSPGDPIEYTKFFVEKAISRYETQGLEATVDYYRRESSIEGQWYVFIIGENDNVIAHPDAARVGLDVNGWVGTDVNGYVFGPEMLSATEEGKWVTYVYHNPEFDGITFDDLSGVDLKNVWVVRHDDLLFASGWYIDVDELTQDVAIAMYELVDELGLQQTIQFLISSPEALLGGVAASAVAYNTSGAVEGEWSAFVADPTGAIQLHFNPTRIGSQVSDYLGAEASAIRPDGIWLSSDNMHVWAFESEGWIFGAGWVDDGSG